jgi:hypothetical protein
MHVVPLSAAIAVFVCGVASVKAQQSGGDQPYVPASVERVRAALQAQPHLTFEGASLLGPTKPNDVRVGVLTFVPPDMVGQLVAVRVPVGDLVSRAAHAVSAAQHRRAENAAHAEVVKALADLQRAQSK